MSLTLYRKYRPQTWEALVDQEHIKQALAFEIAHDKLAHAYLFSGPRGVGKTTVARLIAKSVNCEKRAGGSHEPCGMCVSCEAITLGRAIDVIEIDAASHTGVDNVREQIIELARFTPTRAKYKVFIIDEVHMLSTAAFNALLKTLEEPPSHVIFVLATTELHKVPETIASRCERFPFRRVPSARVAEVLMDIAQKEGVTLAPEVAAAVAARAEGSLRDAQSVLGQLFSLGEKKITHDTAALILPASYLHEAIAWLGHIVRGDLKQALTHIRKLMESGVDAEKFLEDAILAARALMVYIVADTLPDGFVVGEEDEKTIHTYAGAVREARALAIIDTLIERRAQLPLSPLPHLPLELAAIELCEKGVVGDAATPAAPPMARDATPPHAVKKKEDAVEYASPLAETERGVRAAETPLPSLSQVRERWDAFIEYVHEYHHALPLILKTAEPATLISSTLTVRVPYQFHAARLGDTKMKLLVERALTAFFGAPLCIESVHGTVQDATPVPHAEAPDDAVGDLIAVLGGRVIE